MGEPADAGNYTVFQTDGIKFYIEERILEECLEDGKITFHLDQFGRFELILSEY
jgi:hypothetical protein